MGYQSVLESEMWTWRNKIFKREINVDIYIKVRPQHHHFFHAAQQNKNHVIPHPLSQALP